jgi:hypothetical protein
MYPHAYVNESIRKRHDGFQLGQNPMEMSPFEKSLAHKEKMEREAAKVKYIKGVQGPDGGICPSDQY